MLVFEQMEITAGIILVVTFVIMIPFYVLTVHFRHFAPLRDVQPSLCLLTHVGFMLFTGHLFLAWRHEKDLCYELAAMQLLDGVLLYGCFLCQHYSLHKRYRVVTTQLPTPVALVLAALPFMLLSTYRVATREEDHCPNVDAVAGGFGMVIFIVTAAAFQLREHPSSHFLLAKYVGNAGIIFSVIVSLVHQWVTTDSVTLVLLFGTAITANASLLAFVLPPIRLALSHGNEFTDEQRRILNDSVFGASSPMLTDGSADERESCTAACGRKVADCLRCVLASSDGGSTSNTSLASPPYGSTTDAQRRISDLSRSRDRLVAASAASQSPSKQRQEVEAQQELSELVSAVQQGDFYRLQKLMTRRGVALINTGDANGRTLLHHAVRVGELNCIRFLLAMGADTNKFDAKGRAPLHEAVRSKTGGDRSGCITELLRSGAVVNLPTSGGLTALHLAVEAGLLGAVNTLLRHDANPLFGHEKEDATLSWQQAHVTNCQRTGCNVSRKSPLTVAVEMGDDKIVSSMLHSLKMSKSRLNYDVRCVHGMTLLHIALCLGNHAAVMVLMMEGSCSPWSVNEETNMNCFHMAALGDSALSVGGILSHIGAPDLIPEETEFAADATASFDASASRSNGGSGTLRENSYGGHHSSGLPGGNNSSGTLHQQTPLPTTNHTGKRLHVLGTGTENATFLSVQPMSSTTSMPASPSEHRSRQASFMRRVQYGCCMPVGVAPFLSANPVTMGFGEAMAILREHIPNASAEASKLAELEAAVDRVVTFLKSKSNIPEIERVHCAMLVAAKRLRITSTRSMGLLMSSQSFPGGLHTVNSMRSRPTDSNVLQSVKQLLRASDNVGMTPLHYAIQQRNVTLVHLFAAYGAVVAESELPQRSRSVGSSGGTDSVPRSFGSGNIQSMGLRMEGGGFAMPQTGGDSPRTGPSAGGLGGSPPMDLTNDTQQFLSSLTQPPQRAEAAPEALEELSERSYARDVRRYIDDDPAQQELVMDALREGLAIYINTTEQN